MRSGWPATGHEGLVERLSGRVQRAGLTLDRDVTRQLATYMDLLLRWNLRMNLTALGDWNRGLDRLVVEALLAVKNIPRDVAVVDIGSGGGSPAIPMKIARPDLFLRMVEGKTRKAAFLREAVRHLRLGNTVVEGCRYEALQGRPELRDAHKILTVRAVRFDAAAAGRLQTLVTPCGAVLLFCTAGREMDFDPRPPLFPESRETLLESTGSELVVIRKKPA